MVEHLHEAFSPQDNLFLGCIYFMHLGVLPAGVSVHSIIHKRPEEGVRFFRIGVTVGYEPPYGFWESYPGPLQE